MNDQDQDEYINFLNEAFKVHKEAYIYDKVNLKDNLLITIICRVHGEFKQSPINHLQGRGCLRCEDSHTNVNVSIPKYQIHEIIRQNFQSYLEEDGICIVAQPEINGKFNVLLTSTDTDEVFETVDLEQEYLEYFNDTMNHVLKTHNKDKECDAFVEFMEDKQRTVIALRKLATKIEKLGE